VSDIDSAAPQPSLSGERRQVSVLFTDMVGYTAIVETLGEERALGFTRMIYDTLTRTVEAHGGAVRGFAGDSVMAVYGIPEAQEDAALRACRTALAVHAAFAEAGDRIEAQFDVRPSMRVGVCSGTAVMAPVEGDDAPLTAVGSTVNLASRIQSLAPTGGSLICDVTRTLVEWVADLGFDGEHEIKGVTKPQKLWRLQAINDDATRFDASIARGLSRYVGRDAELAALVAAQRRSAEGMTMVDIVAEPGLGKTRLVYEFLQQVQGGAVRVLEGYCATDGQQTPFYPFLDVVRSAFGIRDEDAPAEIAERLEAGLTSSGHLTAENLGLLLNLLGLQPPKGALDGLDGVLIGLRTRDLLPELLKAQCRIAPHILLIEDIHWIDGSSAELLERLVAAGDQRNLMVINTMRPEYVPAWRSRPEVETVQLRPLGEADFRALAESRLGVGNLPDGLVRQITDRAGGNPLFGEEILSFLTDQGALRVENGAVVFDEAQAASGLPVRMQTLFTARIDRLHPDDRALLQAASAMGRRFDPGLLSLVVPREGGIGAALQRLTSQDYIFREPNSAEFAFKHVLLRDSVYQSLLSELRAALHLAIAEAIARRAGDRLTEAAEVLAYHYDRTDRRDLAFRFNALAGTKSLGTFSLGEGNRYFARALELYEQDPTCAGDDALAAFLADYALSLNISLQVNTMKELAARVRPILDRIGDSLYHVHFLHHYAACLLCNASYREAYAVQQDLSAMGARLGDAKSLAYALVSALAVSCYTHPFTDAEFEAKRQAAEAALSGFDDAYLQNYFLAYVGWNEVIRGRVAPARDYAESMIGIGLAKNEPRSLGYGIAMKALIAQVIDDHGQAYELAGEALAVSRAEFERAIANSAFHGALVPLGKGGAVDQLHDYLDRCGERGWHLFQLGPIIWLGVADVMGGRIGEGLSQIEHLIERGDSLEYIVTPDWYRLYLCEIYLGILSGEGGASAGVIVRNLRSLVSVMVSGPKRIEELVAKVRQNKVFDRNGHYYARTELILGTLHKIKKRRELALRHLSEARRIVEPAGPSPMLTRIDAALAELQGA
jgi:class 3 adenylate cyclase